LEADTRKNLKTFFLTLGAQIEGYGHVYTAWGMKLTEHNRVQPIYVPVHTGTEDNKIADNLARMGLELLFVAPEPACDISV
jgi:hypothetical protein